VCEGKGDGVGEKIGIVGIVFVARLAIVVGVQCETVWVEGVERISLLLRIALEAAPATQTISFEDEEVFRGGSFECDRGMVRTRLILKYNVSKRSFYIYES
jgi:hypothetical protein